ncbi:hypothetical protein P148_SR1C00001G0222 [candidate division SR1 bacterium RAAC1_SR1_1]|nr:hypothetical protein P148_SR1C00001G0222 [candidate division SR1 bacterium RAAC1_SR1_1]
MNLPCGNEYDPKKSVWCKRLAEKNFDMNEFRCDDYTKCMGMIEDAICNCLSQKPMHIVKTKKSIQEELVKEFELQPQKEFSEAV